MNSNSEVIEQWEKFSILIEQMETDVQKNARGNMSAGIRVRRGLRLLKSMSSDLIKLTVATDKARNLQKKAARKNLSK